MRAAAEPAAEPDDPADRGASEGPAPSAREAAPRFLGYAPSSGFAEAPALATKLVDRVGAGDAFLSIASLCAAQDAPMDIMLFLGNVGGAEAVATIANKQTLDLLRLTRHVESLLK